MARSPIRTSSGRGTRHSRASRPDDSISYPDMMSGSLTKVRQQVNRMVQEEYTPSSSFNMSTTPGFWTMEASIMLAGPSTDAGIGEILDKRIRQRTTPNGENLVSAAPISPEQRRQHSGGLNTEQGGQQNNCSLQLHGSGRGAQLTIQGRIRVREHWWLFGVIYQSEDEDCEDDEIRLDINDMPYEDYADELHLQEYHVACIKGHRRTHALFARILPWLLESEVLVRNGCLGSHQSYALFMDKKQPLLPL
ncbi:hypothetical protein VitviT2T_011019 [Vitis vinifera]|uniref:Uncharacterized protein n=1 Tax=Vitis vinifera TaxID=29760 RepID=A0ABY9CAJ8_VITVI|nr:hypothetical protein VitviT2T_011019 [Vitis vinifera]